MGYANLHAHTQFSVLDGHALVDDYVKRVAALGHTHAAVTDHGTMAAMPDFFAACRQHGVAPIAGCEVYVAKYGRKDTSRENQKSHHLTLLALSREGYGNLRTLSTLGYDEGWRAGRARVDRELLARHSAGVACLSGCISGELSRAILADDEAEVDDLLDFYQSVYGERFFLELQNHGPGFKEQQVVNRGLVRLARKYQFRVVGTNDSHFCTAVDGPDQKFMLLVQTKGKGGIASSDYNYVRDNEEMALAFGDGALLRNSLEIASWVERYELGDSVPKLPVAPLEVPGEHPDATLERLARQGLADRFGHADNVWFSYQVRLDQELAVIRQMGEKLGVPFGRYLLIVKDLVDFAKRQGIPHGPRGSAAGSLVIWALGISEPDPVAHDLYFERFLNVERVSLPDVDMDFADERRDEIKRHLVEQYGVDCVAHIGTYGEIGPKQAFRDAARTLEQELSRPHADVAEALSNLVPHSQNRQTLGQVLALPDSPIIALAARDADAAAVVDGARKIAGRFRSVGTHASGLVVTDRPIGEIVPLMRVKNPDSQEVKVQTQYEMGHLEALGLLKLDVLGLSELSKMEHAVRLLREVEGVAVDLWALPTDDPATWDTVCSGDTQGLFQLSKPGMTRAVRQLRPRTIEELAMLAAIWRPGPMANLDLIVRRKRGEEEVESPHPVLDAILAPTWGVIVYQEQVIAILVTMAGMSRGQADVVRKMMGKKDVDGLARQEAAFVNGAVRQGHTAEAAQRVWASILPFADYGFNKAHAICYAYLAYQSAWLKTHHPLSFYTAALQVESRANCQKGETVQEKLGVLAQEARKRGVRVLPPDLLQPAAQFTPSAGVIRYGLSALKGIGDESAALIERHAPYAGLADFVRRCPVNKTVMRVLSEVGALPWGERNSQFAKCEEYLKIRGKTIYRRKHETDRQYEERRAKLLADLWQQEEALPLPAVDEAGPLERLQTELALIGFCRSPWPAIPGATATVGDLGDYIDDRASVGGIVVGLKPFVAKRSGQAMARATLLDGSGQVTLMIWPNAWEGCREWLEVGRMVLAVGRVKLDDGGTPRSALARLELLEAIHERRLSSSALMLGADWVHQVEEE